MNAFYLQNENSDKSNLEDSYMPLSEAAAYSGYNLQYLRRLLGAGTIEGTKIGQVWLVRVASLKNYLQSVRQTRDRRYGPRVFHEFIQSEE